MKLEGKVNDLLAVVERAGKVVDSNSLKPILKTVLLEGSGTDCLIVRGTNMLTSVKAKTNAITVFDPGSVCLLASALIPALKVNKGREFTLDPIEDGAAMRLKCGSAKYKFAVGDAADYPNFPTTKATPFAIGKLPGLLAKVSFAVAPEAGKWTMDAIYMEKDAESGRLIVTATDSRVLATASAEVEGLADFSPVLLPVDWCGLLGSWATEKATMAVDVAEEESVMPEGEMPPPRFVYANLGDTTIVSTLPEGEFPAWRDYLDTEAKHVFRVKGEDLRAAINRVVFITDDSSAPVGKFTLGKDNVRIATDAEGGLLAGSAKMDVVRDEKCAEGECVWKLNLAPLSSALSASGAAEYTYTADAYNANHLDADGFTFVVMPLAEVKVEEETTGDIETEPEEAEDA